MAGDEELDDYEEYVAYPLLTCILNVAGTRESYAPVSRIAFFAL